MSEGKLGRIWLETRDGRLPGRVREVQYDRVLFQIEAPIIEADLLEFSLELPDLETQAAGRLLVRRVLATPEGQPAIYLGELGEMPAEDRDRFDQWLDERTAIGALSGLPPGARDFDDLDDDLRTDLGGSPGRADSSGSDALEPARGGRTAIANALRKGVRRSARALKDELSGDALPDWMHDSGFDGE